MNTRFISMILVSAVLLLMPRISFSQDAWITLGEESIARIGWCDTQEIAKKVLFVHHEKGYKLAQAYFAEKCFVDERSVLPLKVITTTVIDATRLHIVECTVLEKDGSRKTIFVISNVPIRGLLYES